MWLATELAKVGILGKVMREFKKQGLDIKYQREIEEWKKYYRERIFSKKLDKQMRDEIDRFIKERE